MMRRSALILAMVIGVSTLTAYACAPILFQTAAPVTQGPPAQPPVLASFAGQQAVTSAEQWRTERVPAIKAALAEHIYGPMPSPAAYQVRDQITVSDDAFDGAARIEFWRMAPREGAAGPVIPFALVAPKTGGPHPVIVIQNFCGIRSGLRAESDAISDDLAGENCGGNPLVGGFFRSIFGAYIDGPPWEDLLARGYAGAILFPGDIAADDAEAAGADLQALPAGPNGAPTGTLAAWGWAFSRVLDGLEADPRIDSEATALWGHSRFGKAALLAAAHDPRVEMVIAHQSGTGGGTLSRNPDGESVAQITQSYPHWFAPQFAGYGDNEAALPLDQHHLLAVIAPRAVLLGNGRRDVWSGPEGAFRAAQGADPAYELLGASGLNQTTLSGLNLEAELGFAMRPGRHGVTAKDWEIFLDWLDAQRGVRSHVNGDSPS